MKVLVLNLPKDTQRWASISGALQRLPYFDIERIEGVYGPSLPATAAVWLTAHRSVLSHLGTLGCFLSHVKAWEVAAASEEASCIVLEDDAVLLGFDRVASLKVPPDADLIFLNDRMSPGSRHAPPSGPVTCLPIADSLRTLNTTGFGVGGDGYILTREGARKIIKATAKDGFFGLPDWRLLRYCVTSADLNPEFVGTRVDKIITHHHNPNLPPAWGVVKAYCLNSPLVAFATGGTSSRDIADVAI